MLSETPRNRAPRQKTDGQRHRETAARQNTDGDTETQRDRDTETQRDRDTETRIKDVWAFGVPPKELEAALWLLEEEIDGSMLGRRVWFDAEKKSMVQW